MSQASLTPAQRRLLDGLRAGLDRAARHDDESIVASLWVRQRYECCFPSYEPARKAAVAAAWHEAGHAVAALAIGARFSSASIHHGRGTEGRVHGIRGAGDLAFVVDAAGQIAERLREWTMLVTDEDVRAWLPTWKHDGGDARHFRRAMKTGFGGDEFGAWRYSEQMVTPLRMKIRQVARALLIHPRYLPCPVVEAIAGGASAPSLAWEGERGS